MPPGAPQTGIQRQRSVENVSSRADGEWRESATEGWCRQTAPRKVLWCFGGVGRWVRRQADWQTGRYDGAAALSTAEEARERAALAPAAADPLTLRQAIAGDEDALSFDYTPCTVDEY